MACGSPLPLCNTGLRSRAVAACRTPRRWRVSLAAFTLTELLVVIAVLTLFAATQLPALTRAKTPVKFIQCQNNCRQAGQATMLHKAERNDCYPYGGRISYPYGLTNADSWPMQLLHYLGGYQTNSQPRVYVCPSESRIAANWVFQMHYQANRLLLSDTAATPAPITGAMVRNPATYWMFVEKDPGSFCNIRPGGLANPVLAAWNYPPGWPGFRRHNGGMSSVAADGHVEWLRMPLYQPGAPAPKNFLELGDCASGVNPASTWQDLTTPGNHNGYRVKLYTRYYQSVSGQPPF